MKHIFVTLPTEGAANHIRSCLKDQPIAVGKMVEIVLRAWEIRRVDEAEYMDVLYSLVLDVLEHDPSVQEALGAECCHYESPWVAMDKATDIIVAKAHLCGLRMQEYLETLLGPMIVELKATIDRVYYQGAFFVVSLETNRTPDRDRDVSVYESWRRRKAMESLR